VLFGALVIGTGLRAAGAPIAPTYWGMFVASMVGTLLALGLGNPFSFPIRGSASHADSFRRVLFLEHKSAFEEAFAKSLRSYGAEIEALDVSEGSGPTRIRDDYDVVIADADLPYGVMLQIKSTVDSRRQVFIVIRLAKSYPLSAPRANLAEILETSGPPQMRREVEDVLGAVPA